MKDLLKMQNDLKNQILVSENQEYNEFSVKLAYLKEACMVLIDLNIATHRIVSLDLCQLIKNAQYYY